MRIGSDLRAPLVQRNRLIHGILCFQPFQHIVPHGVVGLPFSFRTPAAMSAAYILARISFRRSMRGRSLLRSAPEERIGGLAIPAERPGKPCQGHHQQEQSGIEPQRHMAVVPESPPTFVARYFQPVFQRFAGTGNPNHKTAYENYDQQQRSYTHYRFADRLLPLCRRGIHQPAMEFARRLEKRMAFRPSVHLAGIGIHA